MKDPSSHTEVGGVKIKGVTAGSGPALLLLHGLGGSFAAWQPNLEVLARHFTVYAPTLPGHGLSGPIPEYSLETGRRLFQVFLQAEDLEKVYLVGQSMGGLLALDFALSFPERVAKLVLVDSAGLGRDIHWGLRLLTLPLLGEVVCDFLWPRLRRYAAAWFPEARLLAEEDRQEGRVPGSLARLLRIGVGLEGQKLGPPLVARLPTLRVPTLIMWGEQDPVFPVSQAYTAHRALPGSRLHVFPDCGHCPSIESTAEFNAVLLDFLLSAEAAEVAPSPEMAWPTALPGQGQR